MSNKEGDLASKIVKNIQEQNIQPRSVWFYLAVEVAHWVAIIFLLILAGMAIATEYFLLRDLGVSPWLILDIKVFARLALSVLAIWALMSCFLIATIGLLYHTTFRGYRFRKREIILMTFVSAIVSGAVMYMIGIGSEIHTNAIKKIPFYQSAVRNTQLACHNPQSGMLYGQVASGSIIMGEFVLLGLDGASWTVRVASGASVADINATSVRLIGELEPSKIFNARQVVPGLR